MSRLYLDDGDWQVERFGHGGARYYAETDDGRTLMLDAYNTEAAALVDLALERLRSTKRSVERQKVSDA